ncbi:hypothetical protein ACFVKB_40920 [Rhodococcus sp. NPDC127530]|uniref:WapI family immunity protein n=1 Tax=unclassified Rhodococcus (in: high G+C Gram-positive bacteria) TaxID=192944 RepID=UPI0036298716
MTPSLVLGSLDADHLAIVVLGRANPGATDYWDGNWVRSTLRVRAGGFTANITANLRTDEIHKFSEGLKFIDDNLFGAAVLQNMEDWITLSITCTPNGGLDVSGEVMDQPGVGNRLAFEPHDLDQAHLPTWLSQVSEIELRFPVVGEP